MVFCSVNYFCVIFSQRYSDSWIEAITQHQSDLLPTKTVLNYKSWFEYLKNEEQPKNSKFRCRLCFKYFNKMNFPKHTMSAFAKKEGLLKTSKKKNQDALYEHAKSACHLNIISNLKENFAKKQRLSVFTDEQLEETKNTHLKATIQMIRSVFVLNKLSLPFSDHKDLVKLQKLNGVELGIHHYERSGCTAMTIEISKYMNEILIENLVKSQMPISIIIDDTTDAGNNHFKIVYFQTIEETNPVIYFYKLINTTSETGLAGFEALIDAWKSEENKQFLNYMQNNLIGFSSDGAPTNVGKYSGTIKFMRDFAKNQIFAVHCMAHRLELTIQHAFESMKNLENMNKLNDYLDGTITKTYSFYNGRGFKRMHHLKLTSQKYNKKFYALSAIISIRWVASDFYAMKAIHRMWKPLVEDLYEIQNESSEFDEKTKIAARKRRTALIGKNFLLMFYFVFDIVNELSVVSQQMQKREGLVVDILKIKSNLDDIFNHLLKKNGKFVELFLGEVQCVADYDPSLLQPCNTFENYIKSTKILYQNVALKDDKEEIPDISHYRTALINSVIKQINKFFPDGHLESFNVFDPQKMPDPSDYSAIRTYGLTKIKDLNLFFKICDEEKLLIEWQSVLEEILSDSNYCVLKSGYTSVSAFWSQILKWEGISWGVCMKRLVQTVLAIPISSAGAERGFSVLKYIRDEHRSRLTPQNLDTILRIKLNGPDEIADFPAEKYARRWVNKGHLMSDSHLHSQKTENLPKKTFLLKSTLF